MADGSSNTVGSLVIGAVALAAVGAGSLLFSGPRDPGPTAPNGTAVTPPPATTAGQATTAPPPGIPRTGFTPPGYTPGPAAPAAPSTAPGLVTTGTPKPVRIPPVEPGKEPAIAFDATLHDFGVLLQGANPVARFRFQNTGRGPLHIVRIHSHCSCAPAMAGARVVPAGGFGEIRVTFQTAALLGRVSKTVDITSNDPRRSRVVLTLAADVQREFLLTPDAFNFGKLAPGASTSKTVEVRHSTGRAFRVVQVSGAPPSCAVRADPAGTAYEDGTATVWRVVFEVPEQTTAMSSAGRIVLRTEPATPTPLWIPYTLRVQPSIELDPWQVNFGTVAADARPSASVRMRALGKAPFKVLSAKVSPRNQLTVTYEQDGDDWIIRVAPGTAWPKSGRLQASVRVTTDHLPIPAVIPVYASITPNEK